MLAWYAQYLVDRVKAHATHERNKALALLVFLNSQRQQLAVKVINSPTHPPTHVDLFENIHILFHITVQKYFHFKLLYVKREISFCET